MKVLLTNDDGIHSFGIIELARKIRDHADVFIVAPRTEQSGISQAITFLRPLFPVELGSSREAADDHLPGFSVDGTPTDCVKLALFELCPWTPDLVVSGINGGLNVGINTGCSGTVAGALAAATFGIPGMAISLEYDAPMEYRRAAEVVWPLIAHLSVTRFPPRTVININMPTASLKGDSEVAVVPVDTNPLGYDFDKGGDPKGRPYFWSNNKPDPIASPFETDVQAVRAGKIAVSAITYDLNAPQSMRELTQAVADIKIARS